MGCNLCTLQKREEHYKLLYEIAQGISTRRGGQSRGRTHVDKSSAARLPCPPNEAGCCISTTDRGAQWEASAKGMERGG
uniref:Uncharacterized protein n=1 Tax=Knipowitschia caucasica TaxID=637954 RepID=A0AAV2L473_KNICA